MFPSPLRTLARCAALVALGAAAAAAQASALYANFNPTVGGAGDYSSTQYADISGYCSTTYCNYISVFSAGFNFVAAGSGVATRAYLPLDAVFTTQPGAERFYRISIYDTTDNKLVVQGGLLGRYVPIAGGPAVYEFELNRSYEIGQTLSDSDALVAGHTYQAYFHQRYGSMSQTHWMSSNESIEADDHAYVQCANNLGGYCVENFGSAWTYPFGQNYTQAMTGFLPALALTDGSGFGTPDVGNGVPEPGSLALVGAALAALALRRKTVA